MVKLETFTEVIRPAISDRKGDFYAIGTFKTTDGRDDGRGVASEEV